MILHVAACPLVLVARPLCIVNCPTRPRGRGGREDRRSPARLLRTLGGV